MDKYPTVTEEELPDRQFRSSWTVWEKYQTTGIKNKDNYDESMSRVFNFDKLSLFAAFWKFTPYSKLSNFFFNQATSEINRVVYENEEEKTLEGLLCFRTGIEPKWEDPQNAVGSSLCFEVHDLSTNVLDTLWEELVLALLGEAMPHAAEVNGIRILDRMRKHNHSKFEVWLKVGMIKVRPNTPEHEHNDRSRKAISKYVFEMVKKYCPAYSPHQLTFKEHVVANAN